MTRVCPDKTPPHCIPAESAHATDATIADNAWNQGRFEYSVEEDIDGNYVTEVGDYMRVTGVYTIYDTENALPASDYTVLYFNDANNTTGSTADDGVIANEDTLVDAETAATVDKRDGGIPNAEGHYFVAIAEGTVDTTDYDATTTFEAFQEDADDNVHVQAFEVKAEQKAFGEVTAFEFDDDASDDGLSDTTIAYTGQSITVGFAMGGKALTSSEISNAALVSGPSGASVSFSSANATVNNASAGTYKVRLTGTGDYADQTVDVSFGILPVNLDDVVLSIDPAAGDETAASASGIEVSSVSDTTPAAGVVKVNGASIGATDLKITLNAVNDVKGASATITQNTTNNKYYLAKNGKYTFKVEPSATAGDNVVGGPVLVDGYVVSDTVSYYYDGSTELDGTARLVFDPTVNFPFDPSKVTAFVGADKTQPINYELSVTKDGEPVQSYDEPGEYVMELTTAAPSDFAYAGKAVQKFTVRDHSVNYGNVDMFVAVDGKTLNAAGVLSGHTPYTGEAIAPVVALTNADGVLAAGEDYAVSYEDEDGNAVESIVEPGKYTIVATLADANATEVEFELTVDKATIKSAQATAEFFAIPADGSAVQPTFTGSTNAAYEKGLKFDLDAADISVVYYAAEETADIQDLDKDGKTDDKVWVKSTGAEGVAASELEAGDYVADIRVLTSCETLQGSVAAYDVAGMASADHLNVHVKVSETAAYADVDANAWYAESVYKAAEADYGYMTGIPGTNLFLPEGTITRAQAAQVLYNMAGGKNDTGYYPTQFSDVDPEAWYALPVLWASEAGIVTGMGDTGTFAPDQNVTREQAATMLWRYMKAQGKDVSGSADLSAYTDGSSVSGWAGEAMAWAVDAGVFGVGTDQLRPADTLTRAEMAAISVRVQPDGAIERS